MNWRALGVFLLLSACAATGAAAAGLDEHPGYFDLDALQIVDVDVASVDINLQGAMLRLVGVAVFESEPDLAHLVDDLELIRVLVSDYSDVDPELTAKALDRASRKLDEQGWQRVVRVRDADEQVYLYVREVEREIAGLTIMVQDPSDETVLINMVGKIDVDLLGKIGRVFDLPSLEAAMEETTE